MNEHWDDPSVHPDDGRALVSWNDEYLRKAEGLLKGKTSLSRKEALSQGWYFGYFKGPFAKAEQKLEDAIFGRDSLELFNMYPNFPAFKAVFFGILNSLYGVKEAIRWRCDAMGGEAKQWWSDEFNRIKADPLMSFFYDLHNEDKHSLNSAALHPRTRIFEYEGSAPNILSAEGAFLIADQGTVNERRVILPGCKMEFECLIDMGQGLTPLKPQLDTVLAHYKQVVWHAKENMG